MKKLHFTTLIALTSLTYSCEQKALNEKAKLYETQEQNSSPSLNQGIQSEFVEGQAIINSPFELDIDGDELPDFTFLITDLQALNNNSLPDSVIHWATNVLILSDYEILDNSTWGYCDALPLDANINSNGNWSDRYSFALETLANAGQFQGAGNKFLGIRKVVNGTYNYGWIKINCAASNEVIDVISWGINGNNDEPIMSGQTE